MANCRFIPHPRPWLLCGSQFPEHMTFQRDLGFAEHLAATANLGVEAAAQARATGMMWGPPGGDPSRPSGSRAEGSGSGRQQFGSGEGGSGRKRSGATLCHDWPFV